MSRSRRAGAVAGVAAVAAAGVAVGVFLTRGTTDASASSPTTTSAAPLTDGAGFEDVSADPTASIGPDPDAGAPVATDEPVEVTAESVPVTVTYYGWNASVSAVQVGGFVGGVVEDGGVCTLTLTKGSTTVTGRSDAVADATTTSCGEVDVAGDEVTPGTWTAVLSYASDGHTGTSEPVDVEVAP